MSKLGRVERWRGGLGAAYRRRYTGLVWAIVRLEGSSQTRRYAKAEDDWQPGGGAPYVEDHHVEDRLGNGEDESQQCTVQCPRLAGHQDTSIYKDNIFAYTIDASSQRVAAGPYCNGVVCEIRAYTSVDLIPEGWEEMDGEDETFDAKGRALIGRDPGSEEDAEKNPGTPRGQRWHGPSGTNHDDHPGHSHPAHPAHTHDDHPARNHPVPSHGHTTETAGGVDTIQDVSWDQEGQDGGPDTVSTDAVADPTRTNPEGEDTGAAGGHSHDFDINWTHRVGTGYFNSLQCSPPLARCKMPTALGGVVRLS